MTPEDRKARALKAYKLLKIIEESGDDDLFFFLLVTGKQQHRVKWKHQRIDWNYHLRMLRETGKFQSRYHMKEPTFHKLARMLRGLAARNEVQPTRSTGGRGPITPEMAAASGLRFLGGSLPKGIAGLLGMSDSSAHRIIGLFLSAASTREGLNRAFRRIRQDFRCLRDLPGMHRSDRWMAMLHKPAARCYQPGRVP